MLCQIRDSGGDGHNLYALAILNSGNDFLFRNAGTWKDYPIVGNAVVFGSHLRIVEKLELRIKPRSYPMKNHKKKTESPNQVPLTTVYPKSGHIRCFYSGTIIRFYGVLLLMRTHRRVGK